MPSKEAEIQLFNESNTDVPVDVELASSVVKLITDQERCSFSLLEVVYVDEEEIVSINSKHLDRNYITDVITFRYDDNHENKGIQGTVFCCAPRIVEQAKEYNQDVQTEYTRILIHGLLHLAGYEDQSAEEKKRMTAREDHYLRLISHS